MALYLVNPSVDLTLELYVAPAMEEAVCIQWERVKDKAIRQTFVRKLEKQLERRIAECMDWDLKEPPPHRRPTPRSSAGSWTYQYRQRP